MGWEADPFNDPLGSTHIPCCTPTLVPLVSLGWYCPTVAFGLYSHNDDIVMYGPYYDREYSMLQGGGSTQSLGASTSEGSAFETCHNPGSLSGSRYAYTGPLLFCLTGA